ncbi:MAG: hypothetical protein CM1200mP20_11820 [Pseudomonadota bacterium]|nr:MAG: hypothetical protein CM1200mP20_11820 [Pseudomonadota bacterium]
MTRERHWLDLIAVSDIISHDVTPVTLGLGDLAVFDTDEGVTVSMARCTHGGANLCDGISTANSSSARCIKDSLMPDWKSYSGTGSCQFKDAGVSHRRGHGPDTTLRSM